MKAAKNLTSFSEFIDQEHGASGTKAHEEFEASYKIFKFGVLPQQARQAELSGTDNSHCDGLG